MKMVFKYSLRKHIDATMKPDITRAILMEDGISISKIAKPLVTIEYSQKINEIIAAGRKAYEETHAFQIGVFGISSHNLDLLSDKLEEVLSNPKGIPVYDIVTGTPTEQRFVIDVGEFTPMRADDTAEESFNHRGYFVIEIELLRNFGETTFTQ